jgi:hypothetical protein
MVLEMATSLSLLVLSMLWSYATNRVTHSQVGGWCLIDRVSKFDGDGDGDFDAIRL